MGRGGVRDRTAHSHGLRGACHLSTRLPPLAAGVVILEGLQDLPPAKDWTYNRSAIHQEVEEYKRRFAASPVWGGGGAGLRSTRREPLRRNLLVVVGGDGFDCTKWIDAATPRNWDLVWIYYGTDKNLSCPDCLKARGTNGSMAAAEPSGKPGPPCMVSEQRHPVSPPQVYHARGPKWRLVWRLTLLPEWANITRDYDGTFCGVATGMRRGWTTRERGVAGSVVEGAETSCRLCRGGCRPPHPLQTPAPNATPAAIGFWDDDLIVRDGAVINTVFDRFHEFGLYMGQPSVCRTRW